MALFGSRLLFLGECILILSRNGHYILNLEDKKINNADSSVLKHYGYRHGIVSLSTNNEFMIFGYDFLDKMFKCRIDIPKNKIIVVSKISTNFYSLIKTEIFVDFGFCILGSKYIIICGGYDQTNKKRLSSIFVYDIVNNYWVKSPTNLPFAVCSYSNNIVTVNNKIHIIGGFIEDNKFSKHHYSIPLDIVVKKNLHIEKNATVIKKTNVNHNNDNINSDNTNSVFDILKQFNFHNKQTISNELYYNVLIKEGFTGIDDLSLLTVDDLLDYNWRKGDAINFIQKLKLLKNGQFDQYSNQIPKLNNRKKSYRKTSMMGMDVKNPYIILLGISKYNSFEEENQVIYPYSQLPASGKAVEDMFKLLKKLYNYKNTFLHYNEINGLTYNEIEIILSNHKQNIIKLNKQEKIDCILLFYSGHGDSDGIITTDLKRFGYNDIFLFYNNQQLDILDNYPKIYIFDCCRGRQQYVLQCKEKKLDNKSDNNESKEEKFDELTTKIGMGLENDKKCNPKMLHKFAHEFRWFGTERSKSTVMGKAVHYILLRNLQENKYWSIQGGIATRVNNIVSKNVKGQFPDPINRLVNQVYLIPNKPKKL